MSEHSVRTPATANRALILDAAVRVIGRDGVAQLKSAVVAREAGVSVGLVHYHFDTLDQLAREAFLYADAITLRAMAEAASSSASGREEIDARLFPWLGGSDEFDQAWEVWGEFWHVSRHDEDVRAILRESWDEWVQLIAEAVDRGRRDGSIAEDARPQDAARRLAALLESLGQQLTMELITAEDARGLLRGAIEREFPE
ncbi:MAG: TetR family transcriptional regulator C-terminal domain-containing protein [Thermoleophilaceae bacterium]|nr:TetR family transcriptional regulator C-terminal domain-containing protein [Thermoleophilaceae bacterium]